MRDVVAPFTAPNAGPPVALASECFLEKIPGRKAGITCGRCGRPARYRGPDGETCCGRCYGAWIQDCRKRRGQS